MNGVHNVEYNVDGRTQGDEFASCRGLFKNRSIGNYVTSVPSSSLRSSSGRKSLSRNPSLSRNRSLSRSASQRSRTLMPNASGFLRSMSRKNVDHISEEDSLSRSSSWKGSANASPAGGSLSKSTSRKGSTPIMYSNSNGLMKPPPIEQTLKCTLEELCFGCTKRIVITRDVVTNDGLVVLFSSTARKTTITCKFGQMFPKQVSKKI